VQVPEIKRVPSTSGTASDPPSGGVTKLSAWQSNHCICWKCTNYFESTCSIYLVHGASHTYCKSQLMRDFVFSCLFQCCQNEAEVDVTPDKCSARFMLYYDPEVGWVSWWSIWSCFQFIYSCFEHVKDELTVIPCLLLETFKDVHQGAAPSSPCKGPIGGQQQGSIGTFGKHWVGAGSTFSIFY